MVLESGEKDAIAGNGRDHMARAGQVGHSNACVPGARMPVTKDQEIHLGSHCHWEKNDFESRNLSLSSSHTHANFSTPECKCHTNRKEQKGNILNLLSLNPMELGNIEVTDSPAMTRIGYLTSCRIGE